jgi:hypothetical protein
VRKPRLTAVAAEATAAIDPQFGGKDMDMTRT